MKKREKKSEKHRQMLSPIRVVALQSGLSTDVIRAWEKRYRVVKPKRADNGRRLYSDADILQFTLLGKAIRNGYRIGDIANLTATKLTRLINNTSKTSNSGAADGLDRQTRPHTDAVMEHFDRCLKPLIQLDMHSLHEMLKRATLELSPSFFLEDLLSLLIHHVREECYRGTLGNGHVRMFRSLVFSYLLLLHTENDNVAKPPKKVMTCSIKRDTELYSLRASAAINVAGMRSVYLGDETSAEEVIEVFRASAADLVVLCSDGVDESIRVPNTVRNICQKIKKNRLILQQPQTSAYKQVARELDLKVSHDFADLIQKLKNMFVGQT